jgi:putative peptidoglycan lipid II flippase
MPTPPSGTMHRRIAAATGIMMASVFLSRVLGLLRNWAVAHYAGANGATNAFFAAFTLPDFLNYLIAGGSLSITFIPVFAKYVAEGDEREGWHVFSTVITVMGIALVLLIAVGEIFAGPLVDRVIGPGFGPAERQSTIDLTRLMLPAQLFFYEGSILAAVQYAKHHFTVPALAPLIYNSSVIVAGVLLFSKIGITGFSVGVVLGAILGNFLLQVYGAYRVGALFTPNLRVTHPGFVLFLKLSVPIMLALGLTFADDWITRHYASYIGDSVTLLQYAKNLMQAPLGIVGQALGVASFPILAQLYSEKKIGDLNRVLNSSLKALIVALVPIACLMIAESQPLVRLFYTHTRLSADDYQATSSALIFYSLGLIAWGTQYILARGFYATRSTIVPAVVGTVTTFASLPLYIWLMHKMGFRGLAVASSIGIGAYTVVLFVILARRTKNPDALGVVGFFCKVAAASAVIGLICYRLLGWLETLVAWHRPLYALLVLSADSAAGVILLYALLKLLRIHEVDTYVRRGFALISRRTQTS